FSRAGMKILSGVANVATGWMELPKNISIWNQKNNNMLSDFTEGVLWGVVHTAGRTASGAVDLATFWLPTFPTPSPIFVWDDFSKESDYYGFRMGR
ncbi:MAG: exosortase system-associated protein, TIGR04073 family, partial [Nitrosomonas sp.]